MGSKAYTTGQMSAAIVLATVVGAEAASKQTGIQARTIRKWCARAGRAPADGISRTDWAALGDLARTRVAAELASGKLSAVQMATIAGIAERNLREVPEPRIESAVAALDAFIDWLIDSVDDVTENDFHALVQALLQAANAEPDQSRRSAMLA